MGIRLEVVDCAPDVLTSYMKESLDSINYRRDPAVKIICTREVSVPSEVMVV